MSLPTSRNTTYAAGSQVKSADLNDLQDQTIVLETARAAMQSDLTAAEGDIDSLETAQEALDTRVSQVEVHFSGSRRIKLAAAAAETTWAETPFAAYLASSASYVTTGGETNKIHFPIPLSYEIEATMIEIGFGGSVAGTRTVRLLQIEPDGTKTELKSHDFVDPTDGLLTYNFGGSPAELDDGASSGWYVVEFETPANDQIYGVNLVFNYHES